MAKEGSRELELREMRERRFAANAPVNTSRKYQGARKAAVCGNGGKSGSGHPANLRKQASRPHAVQDLITASGPREAKSSPASSEEERLLCKQMVGGSNPSLGPKPKRGRPRIGEKAAKPWIAAGMTKSTWYRRQAEKAK